MCLVYKDVALEGFEPSQAEPESDVLPLHHKAICDAKLLKKEDKQLFFGILFFMFCKK